MNGYKGDTTPSAGQGYIWQVPAASPVRLAEPLDDLILLSQVDLDLLPQVEDGTVPAGAQHLLVERTLQN